MWKQKINKSPYYCCVIIIEYSYEYNIYIYQKTKR